MVRGLLGPLFWSLSPSSKLQLSSSAGDGYDDDDNLIYIFDEYVNV